MIIQGVVIPGDKRGRALGFPTANLAFEELTISPGIYAAWGSVSKRPGRWVAAVHIGPRPAVGDSSFRIEAHFLNFPDQDLYGETVILELKEKIRDIADFSLLKDLKSAIAHDCIRAADILQPRVVAAV
jgi:FAD synthase